MTTDEYPVTIDTAADLIRRWLDMEHAADQWGRGCRAGLLLALAAVTGRDYTELAADDMARRRIQTDLQRACSAAQETAIEAERTAS
jgi:hypothetical protein